MKQDQKRIKKKKKGKIKKKKTMPRPGIIQDSFEPSGLNQGPSDLQSDALPTELSRHP